MLAPNSIMSLNQGADLARWNMQRLYASSPTQAEQAVEESTSVEAISTSSRIPHVPLGFASFAMRLLGLWRPRNAMTGTAAR